MSRRRSTGDLVPKDITEILAREARAQRGQRKPGSSLGQAFSWLKGSRKKKSIGNGLNRAAAGATDTKLGLQNNDPAKAGPKSNEDQRRLTVHFTTSQHHQENVFIEGSRPQYLEDLHTEAQEGLKIQQQEEHKNGVNFPDDESIASSDTICPEQDISSKDRGDYPESISTSGNTDTTVSLSVSTRPVLTRQGSTFKPLNPVKRLDKTKKRSRRTTIMGIPNQVQKELALHRSSTFQPLASTQLPAHNGKTTNSQSGVVVIPTVDGGAPAANKEGARVHLSELEASRDEQLLRKHLQAMYQEEQPFNHQGFGSHLCPTSSLRPKSVAVPGMTTSSTFCPSTMFSFLQEPQGPVMSISPQATYLSTIIPNAVLPASIEVIEIDRSSRTRGSSVSYGNSVRTVSKNSLASGDSSVSPLLSRRSDGDGSQAEHSCNESPPMPTSTSGSNWNESQSSKTIISNSSPVSSKGSTRSGKSQRVGLNGQESHQEHSGGDQDHVSLRSSVSGISSPTSKSENIIEGEESESGSVTAGEDAKDKRNFSRSLSVMKTKQPPAPPRRTNSLHTNKIKSNSRILVESKDLDDSVSGEMESGRENTATMAEIKSVTRDMNKISTPVSNSIGPYSPNESSSSLRPRETSSEESAGPPEPQSESSNSSPQKTPSEGGKFERTMSPSSGYSSQSGTPTLSPKGISPTSPEKQKRKPVKPERSVSRASSSAASPSSSLTSLSSGTSEPVNPDVTTCSLSLPPQGTPATLTPNNFSPNNNMSTLKVEIRELLNIPPPPKVKAPCPPPPETWVHNRHTFELICGSCSNVNKETHKTAQIQDGTVKQAGTQTKAKKEAQVSNVSDETQTIVKPISELSESKAKPGTLLVADPEDVHKELENRKCPGHETKGVEGSAEVQRQEQSSSPVVTSPKRQESTSKKDPPPVMKKPLTILHKGAELLTEQSIEIQKKDMGGGVSTEVHIVVENHTASSQSEVTVLVDQTEVETDRGEVPAMKTLSVEVPKMNKVSPPPTPPPPYHPTPPPSRKTPPSSVSTPPNELQRVQEEIHFVESCWPPPPPPLEGDSVFEGGDEVDFPPPPPPFVTECVPYVTESCIKQLDVPNEHTVAAREVAETNKVSSEAVESVQGQKPDLPQTVPQLVECDNKPEVAEEVSKGNTAEETSCSPVQDISSLSDSVLPPPVETPPLTPNTTAETPASVSDALPSSSSFPRRDSVKSEDQSVSSQIPNTVPVAPPLPAENLSHGVNFRRQPSLSNRDTRSKELLSRHKSTAIPKEDANIPLVTPSLLQMVRLRSVNMTEDQVKTSSEDKPTNEGAPVQENCPVSIPGPQNVPQKPIRKSLSLKSPPPTVKASSVTLNTPSMRLQEAIRMKTAAMSSRDGLPCRLGVRSPPYSCVSEPGGAQSLKSPEGCDVHKSPASTASFIFSRSTKKVIIETASASSPEAQAGLKQSLAAELQQVSDQSRAVAFSNGGVKCNKVPPPVAKKPAQGSVSSSQHQPPCPLKTEYSGEGNGANGGITPPETTTTRVTADTIETLF